MIPAKSTGSPSCRIRSVGFAPRRRYPAISGATRIGTEILRRGSSLSLRTLRPLVVDECVSRDVDHVVVRQAAKSEEGRELPGALFAVYDRASQRMPDSPTNPNTSELRRELGLE